MKQYITFFRMSIMNGLQYKTAAIAGMTTQFFFGLLFIMIFEAFYTSSNAIQNISFEQLVQVVWLQQSFLLFIMLWYRDSELYDKITNGNIAYELCRPTHLYHYWYARLIGQRLSGALLRFLPILMIAFFLPKPYRLLIPHDPVTFILFLITLFLGLFLIVAISMLIYISVFYTLSPTGSLLLFAVFGEFFAGLTIPIPLMPRSIQIISYILPFRYTSDLPFRIYAGHILFSEAIISIFIQLVWLLAIYTIGMKWMNLALKRIVIQGG